MKKEGKGNMDKTNSSRGRFVPFGAKQALCSMNASSTNADVDSCSTKNNFFFVNNFVDNEKTIRVCKTY